MVALPSTSSPSGSGRYNTSVCPGATPLSGVAQSHRQLIARQLRYRVDGLAVRADLDRAFDGSGGCGARGENRLVTGQLPDLEVGRRADLDRAVSASIAVT